MSAEEKRALLKEWEESCKNVKEQMKKLGHDIVLVPTALSKSELIQEQVEKQLGCKIPEELYQEAFTCAKKKQSYLYNQEKRGVIKEDWYLILLIKEYIGNLAFSQYTFSLCQHREKKHSAECFPANAE